MPTAARPRRRLLRLLAALLTLALLAMAGLVLWSRTGVMDEEPAPWQGVQEDPRLSVERTGVSLVLRPSEPGPTGTGLTPGKIAEHRDALPGDAAMVEISGTSHGSFGGYGPQSGDGTATIDDAETDAAVEDAVADLHGTLP